MPSCSIVLSKGQIQLSGPCDITFHVFATDGCMLYRQVVANVLITKTFGLHNRVNKRIKFEYPPLNSMFFTRLLVDVLI